MNTDTAYLVVDDNEADRFLNARVLRKIGVPEDHIREAADGAQALELLNGPLAGQRCVILLDINMPVMDGFTFLREWESAAKPDKGIVVMVTSSQDERDRNRAEAHGNVAGFLTKPLDRSAFQAFLEELLGDMDAHPGQAGQDGRGG